MSHKKVKQEMVVADCSVADEAWVSGGGGGGEW